MTPAELKAARTTLGLSQHQLAQALGVSDRGTVWRWEAGKREIPPYLALAIQHLSCPAR